MGDHVMLLRKGRVVQTGRALDLYRAPKDIFAARTFSDLNEVPARVETGSAKTALGSFPANGLADGNEAIVCVRQRGVRLLPAGEGIPARVLGLRFLGDVALVEMAVQGWMRRSSPACAKATHLRSAARSASVSMPARCWCSPPRTAMRRMAGPL
ncbi:MAG TPA: hypothetical protein VGY14_05925 [Methyloceanibacter sp.]|nr:hypothetical protein [Methyloceanibacter sp.]